MSYELASKIRSGHPWVYRESIDTRRFQATMGSVVSLVDPDGDFIAKCIVDGSTPILMRVISRNPSKEVDRELFTERVRRAIEHRKSLINFDEFQCFRLINGESDGLPGFHIERYGDYVLAQMYTPAVIEHSEWVYDAIFEILKPKSIYEQRRFKPLSGEAPKRNAARLVRGDAAPVELEIQEGDLKFYADVTAPLSTGLFADLRLGRAAIRRWSKDRKVLNLFSYTGAISVYAKAGGASEVTAIDVAAKAHARARRNFDLSGFDGEAQEHIADDALKVLARFANRGRKFDMVAIDPPAFASAAKKGGKPWSAVKDYAELVAASLEVLNPGGILAAACSTHKMSHLDFDAALAKGSETTGRELSVVERVGLPVDFPVHVGFPEGNYLKFAICKAD